MVRRNPSWENYSGQTQNAKKDRIVLGGWLLNERGDPSCAPWFSLSLGIDETPWLFRGGREPSWASTSAELLASLVALKVLPLEKLSGLVL